MVVRAVDVFARGGDSGVRHRTCAARLGGWHLEKNTTLADGGPYAHVRNPLYIGTLLTAAGLVIASRRWELGVLFAAVFC